MHPRLDAIERAIAARMHRYGHPAHIVALAAVFIWFGILKVRGERTATSLIADTVYWGNPDVVVPILGWWEVAIGICLIIRPLIRIALLLLMVRLPGTLLALILLPDVCFVSPPWIPTIEGQYLVKDLALFGAALVIGGTVRSPDPPPP